VTGGNPHNNVKDLMLSNDFLNGLPEEFDRYQGVSAVYWAGKDMSFVTRVEFSTESAQSIAQQGSLTIDQRPALDYSPRNHQRTRAVILAQS
jgi:hypothetical protein